MSLYEITNDLLTVINGGMVVDEVNGEIAFDADNLEELECAYADKLEACGCWIKNMQAEIDALKLEERKLADRRRVKENQVRNLKAYVLMSMEATETSKLETSKVALSTRKSQRVVIDDERRVPLQFVKVTQTINKEALKKALKAGDVQGAHIEESMNLQLK